MIGLTLLVASIGLADSVNPSTLLPAAWLASSRSGRGLLSFTLGAFAVYLSGGIVLVFGPGPALIAALHQVRGPVEHAVEAAVGVAALGFAAAIWRSRQRVHKGQGDEPDGRWTRRAPTRKSAFALGAGIMAIELPTAFIYFGAITAILAAHAAPSAAIALLVMYNALFVAPILALVAIRRLAGDRAEQLIASAEARLQRFGRIALTGAASAGGTALLLIGVGGLLAA